MSTSIAMDQLKAILVDLGIPRESLHDRTLLHQDLQLDSTEMVEIVLGLKQKLGINLKLGGRQDLTLTQLCDRIESEMLAQTQTNHGS
ncbi:MAG: acyl carrier protein [Cyanobacteria bacterium P01_G01_bin.39]